MDHKPLDFKKIRRSRILHREKGKIAFPTREDYLSHLRDQGVLAVDNDLVLTPRVVLDIHRHWHRLGAQGCRFAQLLSDEPAAEGWARHVFTSESGQAMWDEFNAVMEQVEEHPDIDAFSALFPRIFSREELGAFVCTLAALPNWHVDASEGPEPDLLKITVRYILKNGVESWALLFGPFDFLPLTRQSPITELALRPKSKELPLQSTSLNPDSTVAHLADMKVRASPQKFEVLLEKTAKRRREILGGNSRFAKAKSTMLLPRDLWKN